MNILLVKTSSLGDVIHALPAVTEAKQKAGPFNLTWVVEESFADIPRLHPGVDRVLPVAIRRWRRSWWQSRKEISAFIGGLRDTDYDLVIDSQGLIKSAIVTSLSKGPVEGFDRSSAREPFAASFYGNAHSVPRQLHAVQRQKKLFAACLDYESSVEIDYGFEYNGPGHAANGSENSIMLLHGTTWASKEWPVAYWQKLAKLIEDEGFEPVVPAGNDDELATAESILSGRQGRVLDRLPIRALAAEMSGCCGVVSVDTGLGHLATALGIPLIGIFGATDPGLTAMAGSTVDIIVSNHLRCIPCKKRDCEFPIPGDSSSIYPPCLEKTTPERVWQALQLQIGSKDTKRD